MLANKYQTLAQAHSATAAMGEVSAIPSWDALTAVLSHTETEQHPVQPSAYANVKSVILSTFGWEPAFAIYTANTQSHHPIPVRLASLYHPPHLQIAFNAPILSFIADMSAKTPH
jgi:hypothetical protein